LSVPRKRDFDGFFQFADFPRGLPENVPSEKIKRAVFLLVCDILGAVFCCDENFLNLLGNKFIDNTFKKKNNTKKQMEKKNKLFTARESCCGRLTLIKNTNKIVLNNIVIEKTQTYLKKIYMN
jgi:hypothetical protein